MKKSVKQIICKYCDEGIVGYYNAHPVCEQHMDKLEGTWELKGKYPNEVDGLVGITKIK